MVRAVAFFKSALNLENTISMGLRSGGRLRGALRKPAPKTGRASISVRRWRHDGWRGFGARQKRGGEPRESAAAWPPAAK